MMSSQTHSEHNQSPSPELVPPRDRTAAITRLLPHGAQRADADRFEAFAHDNQIPLDWLWTLRNQAGQPETCVLAVPSPGRTAMLFTSQTHGAEPGTQLSLLLNHCLDFLNRQPVDLAQALLMTTDQTSWQAFEASGFHELAVLQYMEMLIPKRVEKPTLPQGLELVTYEESRRSDLIAALEASYEDTLDCPSLRGLRKTDDVITGHQSTGQYKATLWTLAMENGAPVGAILINQSNRGNQAELVYIGLASQVRGRGWGRVLLSHGLALAASDRLQQLSLAVDLENTPAMDLYTSTGFIATGRRQAVIRSTT
ncbi:MAG: GNAT family N-acetyltransferase [Planctomycetota bacterium]|nr:GNAT family N-acetyltransferase [Planctomycetota bacterium]